MPQDRLDLRRAKRGDKGRVETPATRGQPKEMRQAEVLEVRELPSGSRMVIMKTRREVDPDG